MSNIKLLPNQSTFFYLKLNIKNILFFIVMLVAILLTLRISETLNFSIFQFTTFSYFTFITLNFFFLISSTITTQKQLEIISFLEKDSWKFISKICMANLILMSLIVIFPVSIMFFLKNSFTMNEYLWLGIIHFFIIYYSSNFLFTVIGISVGLTVKNNFAIVISILIFILLIRIPYMIHPTSPFGRLFNIYDDEVFFSTNDLAGVLFNISYLLDKLFVVLFILLIGLLIRIIVNKKKKLLNVGLISIILLSQVIVVYNYIIQKEVHHQYNEFLQNEYQILSHKMKLNLGNKLTNESILNIKINEDTNTIQLFLDRVFDINEIKIDNTRFDFTRENDLLEITGDFKKDQQHILKITYQGKVNIVDDLGFHLFYVSPLSVNLPGDSFYWYPKTTNYPNKEIYFDVELEKKGTIFSNLAVVKETDDKYNIRGNASDLFLFSGQYKVMNENEIEYVIPIGYEPSIIQMQLSSITTREEVPNEVKKKIIDKNYSRVVMGIWPLEDSSALVKVSGDTIFVRFFN